MTGLARVKEPLWGKQYLLSIAVNLCIAAIFYLLITTTALYALERFRTDEFTAGIVSGSFIGGAVIARTLGGKFLDVIGRRRLLIMCLVACTVLGVAQAFASELLLLIVLRGLHGVAFGAASSAVSTGVFSFIPASRRSEGTGYYGLSTTLGSAFGPLSGVALIAAYGFESLFLAAGVWAVLGLACGLLLKLPERTLSVEERAALRSWNIWTFIDRGSVPVAGIMLIAGLAFAGVLGFLNPYAVEQGLGTLGGVYFGCYALMVLCSRLFVGRIQDRLGDNAVAYPLLVCLAIALALLAVGLGGVLPYLSAALLGFGFGALMPTIQSIVVRLAGPTKIALATSTFFLMVDLGVGLGPVLAGAIVGSFGYPAMFGTLSAVALGGVAYYWMAHGRASRRSRGAVA